MTATFLVRGKLYDLHSMWMCPVAPLLHDMSGWKPVQFQPNEHCCSLQPSAARILMLQL